MTKPDSVSMRRLVPLTLLASAFAVVSIAIGGCHCGSAAESHEPNPALRPIQTPAGAMPADVDRAALARFVGVWRFEGWASSTNGSRPAASGTAAAAIESEHFVLLDIRSTAGELVGRAGRTAGSMLFASEPDVGITLTAWGDGAPVVRRLTGEVYGNGSAFSFHEASGGTALTVTFETDDRWIAEVRQNGDRDQPVVAKYTFTREAK